MILRLGKQSVDLRPFLWAAIAWGALGATVLYAISSDRNGALKSFALYFGLSVMDLFFIVKTVAAALVLMSDQGAKNRSAHAIQAFTYGGLKFLCLGAIGVCLWKVPSETSGGLLFGLGALVAIPLLGGFLWSQMVLRDTELKDTE
jgi:FtsH-binding integral membrane protein